MKVIINVSSPRKDTLVFFFCVFTQLGLMCYTSSFVSYIDIYIYVVALFSFLSFSNPCEGYFLFVLFRSFFYPTLAKCWKVLF